MDGRWMTGYDLNDLDEMGNGMIRLNERCKRYHYQLRDVSTQVRDGQKAEK
jgi:hypothetical protein